MMVKNSLKRFLADESGASMAEYALLLGVVVIAILAAARVFGTSVSSMMTRLGNTVGSQT
jgi:pilus assembly protein Flp/PilA